MPLWLVAENRNCSLDPVKTGRLIIIIIIIIIIIFFTDDETET